MKDLDDDQSPGSVHPFWNIRRSIRATECNCDMVEVAITSMFCSDMRDVTVEGAPSYIATKDLEVVVPCIRNTEKIAAGQELVLRWETMLDGWTMVGKRYINALSEQAPSAKKGRM